MKDAWRRHFIDSAQLLPFITPAATLYDLGTGAGFSGMVLAILCPELSVTLIESDSKKCAFLQTVSRETATPVTVRNERIEASGTLPAPDIVTARALAELASLYDYVWPWAAINPRLRLVFPKGERFEDEIKAARMAGWAFDCAPHPSLTSPASRILVIENLRKE